jgi:predicted nucleic acid-binding protein
MFIDSNIFLYAISIGGKKEERCRSFLDKIARGEQNSSTSALVLDEVAWIISEKKGEEAAVKAWEKIMAIPNLKIVGINEDVARLVPSFLRQGLDPRDAIHAATMKFYGIQTILSYDRHFDLLKGFSRQEP